MVSSLIRGGPSSCWLFSFSVEGSVGGGWDVEDCCKAEAKTWVAGSSARSGSAGDGPVVDSPRMRSGRGSFGCEERTDSKRLVSLRAGEGVGSLVGSGGGGKE